MSPRAQLIVPLSVFAIAVIAMVVAVSRLGVPGGYAARITLPQAIDRLALPQVEGDAALPLVVIDAGHGGHDPGASGQGLVEKNLVLMLARALRDELEEQGEVRVALTRDDDRYLLHAERFEIARRLEASLFVSIHADSAGESSDVAGASIYTLSNEASSDAAARFAERENASDRLNGIELGGQSDTVSNILVELSQRRTQEQSAELSRLILREGQEVERGEVERPKRYYRTTMRYKLTNAKNTPIEVDHLAQVQDAGGWVDITRQDIPQGNLYSWWSYRSADWDSADKGRRLDHVWATPDISNAGHGSRILRHMRGYEQPSDHVPVLASFDL